MVVNIEKEYTMSLEDDAKEYFIFFSKFEYALKEAGLFKKEQVRAEPDWGEYINSLSELSLDDLSVSDDAKYLIKNPPKNQIINNGKLGWKKINLTCLCDAINACKRVRNNLFHGAKPSNSGNDTERNKKLLKGSMDILKKTLENNESVKGIFDDANIDPSS